MRVLHSGIVRLTALLVCLAPVAAGAQPTPVPSAVPSGSARDVLGEFATAWAGVTSYTATVTVMERKDAQIQNIVLEYTFSKPSSVTVHVDAGQNAGVTMVWDGGTTIVAHRGSGFAALFKKTFPLHDPQATTIRGSSIDQLSFGAVLAHAQEEPGKLTETPQNTVDGESVNAVTLMSTDPASNAGLSREVVELSINTHLPVRILGYDGATLVRQIDFSKVVLKR
jgi:outer membrane lipoprotein-sorting protein